MPFASRRSPTFRTPWRLAPPATWNLRARPGRITAQESRAIGVHWNWFPDADVNSNPANPIINTRSFGEDPKLVGDMVAAYIEGAHEYGMLTTAKHFPGHGDTDTDSHTSVPVVNQDKAYFENVALPPFRAAIKAGVDAIMVAHIAGSGARSRAQSRGFHLSGHRDRPAEAADGLHGTGGDRRAWT